MAKQAKNPVEGPLSGAFGFNPEESPTHFIVYIPTSTQQPVEISEHLSWDPNHIAESIHYGVDREDGQVRARLARPKWNEIAEFMRAEMNRRLKSQGKRPGKWKSGYNPISRLLGKELTLMAWAIEEADPALIPNAIANWQGLAPEERWWLYTMTAAASGNYVTGRGKGWRKAVRYALTENPVNARPSDQPIVPEFFRLVSATSDSSSGLRGRESTDKGDEDETR